MMAQNSTMPPRRSVWHAMWAEVCYHKIDFLQLAGIAAGIYLFFFVVFTGGAFLFGETVWDAEMLTALGVMPLGVGIFAVTLVYGGQITVYQNIGLQMSIPRRHMIARSLWVGVLIHACWVAVGCALYALTFFVGHVAGCEVINIFKEDLPDVLWLAYLCAPLSIGTLGGAVLMRFGRKGFWVLYAIFMSVMILPSAFPVLVEENGPFGFVWTFLAKADFSVTGGGFWLVAALLCLLLLSGIAMLWRVVVRG